MEFSLFCLKVSLKFGLEPIKMNTRTRTVHRHLSGKDFYSNRIRWVRMFVLSVSRQINLSMSPVNNWGFVFLIEHYLINVCEVGFIPIFPKTWRSFTVDRMLVFDVGYVLGFHPSSNHTHFIMKSSEIDFLFPSLLFVSYMINRVFFFHLY